MAHDKAPDAPADEGVASGTEDEDDKGEDGKGGGPEQDEKDETEEKDETDAPAPKAKVAAAAPGDAMPEAMHPPSKVTEWALAILIATLVTASIVALIVYGRS